MRNKIISLPIVLDRKATVYEGSDEKDSFLFQPDPDDNSSVILTSDGTNVEYWLSPFFDVHRPPLSEIQIELNITVREFWEYTQGEDTYVDLVLIDAGKVGVFITTEHDVIYDEVHMVL